MVKNSKMKSVSIMLDNYKLQSLLKKMLFRFVYSIVFGTKNRINRDHQHQAWLKLLIFKIIKINEYFIFVS